MALRIKLKPNEMVFIGSAVIQNGREGSANLILKNKVPVLRAKEIYREEEAVTPAKRLYFLIQLAYMFGSGRERMQQISQQIKLVGRLYPPMLALAVDAGQAVLEENYYAALKMVRRIIEFESELMKESAEDESKASAGEGDTPVGQDGEVRN